MQFDDEIRMVRDYDAGTGLVEGAIVQVAGSPGDGQVTPGMAETLCGPAADGDGPYAVKIQDEDDGVESTDEEE